MDVTSGKLRVLPVIMQKRGRKIPALFQLLSVSEGDFDIKHLDFYFMQVAFKRLPKGKKIILVNWVILEYSAIVLFTLESDSVLNIKQLDIKLKEIFHWTKSYFTFPTSRDAPLARSDGDKVWRKPEGLGQGLESSQMMKTFWLYARQASCILLLYMPYRSTRIF